MRYVRCNNLYRYLIVFYVAYVKLIQSLNLRGGWLALLRLLFNSLIVGIWLLVFHLIVCLRFCFYNLLILKIFILVWKVDYF